MIKTIFLDMDGVCYDFASACLTVQGREWKDLKRGKGHDLLGNDVDRTWEMIDACGVNFWANLEPLLDVKKFYERLTAIAPTYFLSSPSRNPSCVAGKLMALQKVFGKTFTNFIFTNKKFLLARENAVLIDDTERHNKKFSKHGGVAPGWPARIFMEDIDFIQQFNVEKYLKMLGDM